MYDPDLDFKSLLCLDEMFGFNIKHGLKLRMESTLCIRNRYYNLFMSNDRSVEIQKVTLNWPPAFCF